MPNLIKNVQAFAHQKNLWKEGAKILVGVSGGADSICLFHILLALSKKYSFSLHIVHVNHCLRKKDSDLDEKFVINLAQKNNISISTLKLEKPLNFSNLEDQLRQKRYAFFEEIRKKLNFDSIAVAHHQNDQAETVLLRILRGSGLDGLSSMKAKNGKIIRPLLNISKKEILFYLKQNRINFRTDKSNFQQKFFRNKIRLDLIPYLEKNFNPRIQKNLAILAETTAEDFAFINNYAEKKCVFFEISENNIRFNCQQMLSLPVSIQRCCLRKAIKKLRGDIFNIEYGHLLEIEKIIKSSKNKNQQLFFKGLKITKKGDIVDLHL